MKKLGFGMMRLPMNNKQIDMEAVKKMVDELIRRGFNYFDTAYMYCDCNSEYAVKECIVDRYPRDAYTITDKLPSYEIKSFEDRDRVFDEQKKKTGLEFFDYYWLHNVNKETLVAFDKYDCFEFVRQKKESGEAKHIGFSFHDGPELLDELLNKYPYMEYVQLQINYLDWEAENVRARENYEVCLKHNKPVIIMEPVKGGQLVKLPTQAEELFKQKEPNMSNPSWAIRFAASLDGVFKVLSGMSNMEQLLDNLSYMEDFKPLTKEEHDLCLEVGEIINKTKIIPCTGCSYCTVKCPMAIPTPKLFSIYNSVKQNEKDIEDAKKDFEEILAQGSGPDDCIECGECEGQCPQHLKIRDYLKQVSTLFKGE